MANTVSFRHLSVVASELQRQGELHLDLVGLFGSELEAARVLRDLGDLSIFTPLEFNPPGWRDGRYVGGSEPSTTEGTSESHAASDPAVSDTFSELSDEQLTAQLKAMRRPVRDQGD